MRPWTFIATEKQTGIRVSNCFQGPFDCAKAEVEFKEKYPDKHLEALLPGTHVCTTFETKHRNRLIHELGD
jgi:hypothetical protein